MGSTPAALFTLSSPRCFSRGAHSPTSPEKSGFLADGTSPNAAHGVRKGGLAPRRYLRLCLAVPAVIMSDAAVEQRRALIRRKKSERTGTRPPGAKGLTEEQRTMIRELMDAQMKTFDTTFSHFKDFRV